MSFIIQAVATYAPWIYAACGLVALYQLYQVVLVRSERRQALFLLEREKAIRDMYRIFYVALILLSVMGVTYFTSTTLVSAVEPLIEQALAPTPEIPNLPTPTNHATACHSNIHPCSDSAGNRGAGRGRRAADRDRGSDGGGTAAGLP